MLGLVYLQQKYENTINKNTMKRALFPEYFPQKTYWFNLKVQETRQWDNIVSEYWNRLSRLITSFYQPVVITNICHLICVNHKFPAVQTPLISVVHIKLVLVNIWLVSMEISTTYAWLVKFATFHAHFERTDQLLWNFTMAQFYLNAFFTKQINSL